MAQGVQKASAHADSNEYERVRDSSPIERKSYRAYWKAGDALNDRRRNSSANCAGQQSATIDRWQKPHDGAPLRRLQLILSKYATMGPLGAATKRPEENLGANKARLNSFDLAF